MVKKAGKPSEDENKSTMNDPDFDELTESELKKLLDGKEKGTDDEQLKLHKDVKARVKSFMKECEDRLPTVVDGEFLEKPLDRALWPDMSVKFPNPSMGGHTIAGKRPKFPKEIPYLDFCLMGSEAILFTFHEFFPMRPFKCKYCLRRDLRHSGWATIRCVDTTDRILFFRARKYRCRHCNPEVRF